MAITGAMLIPIVGQSSLPFLITPMCAWGLLMGWAIIWIICPQAFVVMFLRQSKYAYDSIGANTLALATIPRSNK